MLTEINFEDRLDLNREEERVSSTILHPFGDLTIVSHLRIYQSGHVT